MGPNTSRLFTEEDTQRIHKHVKIYSKLLSEMYTFRAWGDKILNQLSWQKWQPLKMLKEV